MKRLLLPLLLLPGVAVAGLVIVDDTPAAVQKKLLGANIEQMAGQRTPAIAPGMQVTELDQWEIKPGASLRTTLESWCERANYRLVWNVEGGFRSQGGFAAEGDFKKAVFDLFAAIPQDLHLNIDITKNRLVLVTRGTK